MTDLLRRRPEGLAVPQPVSLSELAERLATPAATVAALRRLDRPTLQVAEALAALGGRAERPVLDQLLGAGTASGRADVTRALDTLRANALVLDDAAPRLVPAAAAAWPRPLGLGDPVAAGLVYRTADQLRTMARHLGIRPAGRKADILDQVLACLRDGERVLALVAGAPADARDLLEKAAAGGEVEPDPFYYSSYGSRSQTPQAWAIARGLLARTSEWGGELTMPAEVALALRGSGYAAPFDSAPPSVERSAADPATTARAAAAAGAAMVRLVTDLLEAAGKKPVPTLRTGGVGLRELKRLAKVLGCTEPDLRLGLSVAAHAGLLSLGDGHAAPTAGYDGWRGYEPADQLSTLLRAWWRSPSAPLAASGAVTPGEVHAGTVELRAAVIAAASEPEAATIKDPRALADLVIWRQPLAFGDPDTAPDQAVACWQEAALLGVTGAGVVTAAGHALLGGADDLTAVLGDIGTTQHHARLQADLTAVVTGSPDTTLSALLDLAADPETRGVARTWRFSPATVRRALDAGHTASSLLDALADIAVGELPQPLRYLVADVARRHGSVRASTVACCLRSEDTALLNEIVADRRLRALGLRQLAPTVLAAAAPLQDVLSALRNAGYAPVAEADDGTPIVERAIDHRASASPPHQARAKSPAKRRTAKPRQAAARPEAADLVRKLLAAPDETLIPLTPSLEAVRRSATNLTTSEARILAYAIDHRQPVTISYVNRDGNPSNRTIDNIELTDGSLLAWCRLREDERWFNLKRIIAVEPADPA
ncbi:helicase-associated domain-containing protein [Phytohabitans flavus]|uniref:helicase-associated domain-containing protein n=1 Tax=Phytohabitans flavus TaxID=1076124 RepID=UPI001563EF11|nr:helicase-associated domain-containing protein [Phytohabitans flavus]